MAACVAAIVALQSTGFSIQQAVAGDARVNAQADVVITNRQRFFSDQAQLDTLKQKGTILAKELLGLVGLDHRLNSRPGQLSGGE